MRAPSHGRPAQTVRLPALPRSPLLLMLAVGAVLLGLGVAADSGAAGLILMGLGLAIAGFVLAILVNREAAAALEIDEDRQLVVVVGRGDRRADIPMASLIGAEVTPVVGSSTAHGVWLRKRDRGQIQLARFKHRAAADRLAEQLQQALARVRQERPIPSSPEERLASAPLVRVDRGERALDCAERGDRQPPGRAPLRLSWPAAQPAHATVPFLLGAAGIALVAYGLYEHGSGPVPAALVGAFAALLALAMFSGLRHLKLTESVCIDDENVTLERRRGQQVLRRHAVPVRSLVAVDYSHEFSTMGGVLTLRADETQLAQPSVQVPLGPLTLADRINVEMAISEELALRTGSKQVAR